MNRRTRCRLAAVAAALTLGRLHDGEPGGAAAVRARRSTHLDRDLDRAGRPDAGRRLAEPHHAHRPRHATAQPLRNVSLRAEIKVGGVHADFGSLSARNLVTGIDGRATVVYTAPAAPGVAVDNGTVVDIVITPVGTDFNNTTSRTAAIRLVPPGIVVPPDGLKPNFTFTPTRRSTASGPVRRQRRARRRRATRSSSYSWNFGDGGRGSGMTASHLHDGRHLRRHADDLRRASGAARRSRPTSWSSAGVNPTAAFTSSPSDPLVNQAVNFNASGTRAAPGHTIKSYDWDFGDGVFGSGITTTHTYGLARSYVVVLTVTDDSGKKGTATGTVAVK